MTKLSETDTQITYTFVNNNERKTFINNYVNEHGSFSGSISGDGTEDSPLIVVINK